MSNTEFLYPHASQNNPASSENQVEKTENSNKSDLELKREMLRKKKEELEKKLEKNAIEPKKKESEETKRETDKNNNIPMSNAELLKKKREELERKKMQLNQMPVNQPENSNRLDELRKKYQKKTTETQEQIVKPLNETIKTNNDGNLKESQSLGVNQMQPSQSAGRLAELKLRYQKNFETSTKIENTSINSNFQGAATKPENISKANSTSNKLEELKKKYQKNELTFSNRMSEPVGKIGKSISTSHVFKYPRENAEKKNQEEEEKESSSIIDNKEDFFKKFELLQQGLDKKMEKLKSEKENEEKEKVDNFFINATRSVDLDQPNISLNQYKADLKKSLLSINPEAEKLMNITKKIMTPSGIRIHSTLAERVAGLEALFSSGGNVSNIEEMKPELKKKIEEEIAICLNLYHLNMERPELPEKRQRAKNWRKRQSKEWI